MPDALVQLKYGMPPPIYVFLSTMVFVFGACIGSFLNVCIHRIPRDESIVRPRSRCPGCGHMIAWYDNVPLLSYALLGARCRHCRTPIAFRYWLVEFITALCFLLVWLTYGLELRTPVYWLVTGALIAGSFIDLEHMILPDRITIGGIIAGPLVSLVVPRLHLGCEHPLEALRASLIGLFVGVGLLLLIALFGRLIFKKDAMGMGDVKLLGAIGAFMGMHAVFFTIVVSSLVGSIAGVGLILAAKKGMQSKIPYGPYLAIAAMAWFLGGSRLWQAYLQWLRGGVW